MTTLYTHPKVVTSAYFLRKALIAALGAVYDGDTFGPDGARIWTTRDLTGPELTLFNDIMDKHGVLFVSQNKAAIDPDGTEAVLVATADPLIVADGGGNYEIAHDSGPYVAKTGASLTTGAIRLSFTTTLEGFYEFEFTRTNPANRETGYALVEAVYRS